MQINTQDILEAMVRIVKEKGLDLLNTYPDDLLKHDKQCLDRAAAPGAQIAWMVGHLHTHIFPLGVHHELNTGVSWVTNLANDDCFFLITINRDGTAKFKEVDRAEFSALQRTSISYRKEQSGQSYWLTDEGMYIGYIEVVMQGSWADRKAAVTITPVEGIAADQKYALETWADFDVNHISGSLFTPRTVEWKPATRTPLHKAA